MLSELLRLAAAQEVAALVGQTVPTVDLEGLVVTLEQVDLAVQVVMLVEHRLTVRTIAPAVVVVLVGMGHQAILQRVAQAS